jgi:hypothetical protein
MLEADFEGRTGVVRGAMLDGEATGEPDTLGSVVKSRGVRLTPATAGLSTFGIVSR